ncbi:MAG: hypothetical protein E7K72_00785 [Roseomonas mucosa]|nr:hypothetical protein [Roseomonas mucosa]
MVDWGLLGFSWEEDLDAAQRARLACRIVAELDARMRDTDAPRLYVATGHPSLSRRLGRALDEIASGTGRSCRVIRPNRPDAYATSDPKLFAQILPILFEFGPPEISILNCGRPPGVARDGLGAVITAILEGADNAISDAVRMDFDSGDLFRIG